MKTDELRQRTFQFGIRCIKVAEALPAKNAVGQTLSRQLLRCGTAVGANYRAALRARSRAEFIAKLGIVEEECDEAIYWIEVIAELNIIQESLLGSLLREADELLSITISSIKTARANERSSPRNARIRTKS